MVFQEFDEEEYAALEEERQPGLTSGGVTLEFGEEDEEEAWPVVPESVPRDYGPEPGAGLDFMGAPNGAEAQSVFGTIASALSRMADAAERGGGVNPFAPAAYPAPPPAAPPVYAEEAPPEAGEDALSAALEARLREMDELLRRLQEENELLRTGAYAPAAAAPEVPAAAEGAPVIEAENEPEPEEEEPERGPFDGLEDEDYAEGEDGELVSLFRASCELEDEDEEPEEDEEEEDESEDFDFDFDEDEDDEDEDEDEEEEYGDEEESDEDEDDFMTSFCSFASSLMSMTPFERMRANGKEVMAITLEDLDAEVKAQAEQRRREREAAAG